MQESNHIKAEELPNIEELLQQLLNQRNIFQTFKGWQQVIPNIKDLTDQHGLSSSLAAYYNHANPNDFIVSRLQSKRYCLKPNLHYTPYILRGQNREYPQILSAFERLDGDSKLISNLKTLDFINFIKTHPLCKMFDHGIKLSSFSKPIFFEMNYYGLAQHYNFNTGLIDFTSNPLIAAFFATTKNIGNDRYVPIENTREYSYGVIYVHYIKPDSTFGMFSTIGQQIFPRTGAQRGFFFQEQHVRLPIQCLVKKYYFKQDSVCSRKIFQLFNEGKSLFPKDNLCEIAKNIHESHEVSLLSFAENLYANPSDSLQKNLKRCKDKGIFVNPQLRYSYSSDLLATYYQDLKNGLWEQFCEPIYFHHTQGKKLKEELLNLPNNPNYQMYFNKNYHNQLYYHMMEQENAHKKGLQNL